MEYLGHVIARQWLKKSEGKTKAIVNAPRPENLTEVRAFQGMVNYYNKLIPDSAKILRPIYDLLKTQKAEKSGGMTAMKQHLKKSKK